MSAVMYGADADELDRLAAEFRATADEIDGQVGGLSRFLNGISWLGDIAIGFTNNWIGTSIPQIGLSTNFLREAADTLSRNAADQRRASRASGSGPLVCAPRPDTPRERDARDRIRGWLDTGGWGVTGDDLDKIYNEFARLTPAERAAVFAGLTDAELAVLKDQMQESPMRGGWHQHEQAAFLQMLLPALSPDEARRLMGSEWAWIERDRPHDAEGSHSAFAAELLGTTGNESEIPPDEIQIRKVGPNQYIVIMPGVTDLSDGFEDAKRGAAAGVRSGSRFGLPGAITGAAGGAAGAMVGEWKGTNAENSARDMHYAMQSETGRNNGSHTGQNGYALAVKQAMQAVGVPAGADVMLVGHSFGAYTAGELATDPSFNNNFGHTDTGYHVTHVLGAGASAAFRFNDLPPGTDGLLVNNLADKAYRAELALPTNNEYSANEVTFTNNGEGHGHHPTNYRDFVETTQRPAVTSFTQDAHAMYGGDGTRFNVHVEDPYRLPT